MMARYLIPRAFVLIVFFSSAAFAPAAEDRDVILAKAKEEKTLVVYNSMELIDASALVEAFKKRYPYVECQTLPLGRNSNAGACASRASGRR